MAASHFAVNVLAENQVELSRRFASAAEDKFARRAVVARPGRRTGAGRLRGGVRVRARVVTRSPATMCCSSARCCVASESAVTPLLFQSGHYRMLGEIL